MLASGEISLMTIYLKLIVLMGLLKIIQLALLNLKIMLLLVPS